MSVRTRFVLLICLVAPLGGCRTADGMRNLPLDLGRQARYALPAEDLRPVVATAMEEVGAGTPMITRGNGPDDGASEDAPSSTAPAVLMATKGMSLFSHGELTRVVVRQAAGAGHSEIRAVSQPRSFLDWTGRADRRPLRILGELDRRLGPGAILPYDGMRVRGRRANGSRIVGVTRRADDGSWLVRSESEDSSVSTRDLTGMAVHRGSYTHQAEWALGFAVVGLGIGLAMSPDCPRGVLEPICEMSGRLMQANAGTLIGGLVGLAIGLLDRTDVWSPMLATGPER